MSGLSVAACMERSERFERWPRIFEVHTVHDEGGVEALGAGGERRGGGRKSFDSVSETA